jgi:LAGLIDADG DNA endonuclease family
MFVQGIVHKDYLMHLYELFKSYCSMVPKTISQASNSRNIFFNTCSLTCFNELYDLFYPGGIKIVPQNIGELLTPLVFIP